MSLPSVVVFSLRGSSPLRYTSMTGPDRLLRCGPDDGVFTPTAKFALEDAGNGFFHIRSCYNNCYWVREIESEAWLSASATTKEEDISKEGSTVFRITLDGTGNMVRFQHTRSSLNVVVEQSDEVGYGYMLGLQNAAPTEFSFIDLASLSNIPTHVFFKGDNGKLHVAELFQHARFAELAPEFEQGFEVAVTRNGDICIFFMIDVFPVYLEVEPRNYWLGCRGDLIYPRSMYEIVPSSPPNSNVSGIALRSRTNNKFLRRSIDHYQHPNCIKAIGDSPNDSLTFIEVISSCKPEMSRVIVDTFRHGRVYNLRLQATIRTLTFENETDQDLDLPTIPILAYVNIITRRFGSSITVGNSSAEFNTRIPTISQLAQVDIPDTVYTLTSVWGSTMTLTKLKNGVCSFTAPARTRSRTTVMARFATCEVPFTYRTTDELYNGQTVTQDLYDGVFTSDEAYGFELRLDSTEPISVVPHTDQAVKEEPSYDEQTTVMKIVDGKAVIVKQAVEPIISQEEPANGLAMAAEEPATGQAVATEEPASASDNGN